MRTCLYCMGDVATKSGLAVCPSCKAERGRQRKRNYHRTKRSPFHGFCCRCQVVKVPEPKRVCPGCSTAGKSKHRLCRTCGGPFTTANNSTICNPCKHQQSKHPCADCGVPIDPRAAVCMKCWGARHTGEKSPKWKSGRTRTVTGYIKIQCPDHPRARAKSNQGNYVLEHVLVMEQMIGRYLLPEENVHHKNGVKDDNRPANLELWTKGQPAGQRARDLVVFAREILALYDDLPDGV